MPFWFPTSIPRSVPEMWERMRELVRQLEPVVLENVAIGTTETAVAHGLGEVPGWVGWDAPHCISIVRQTKAPTKTALYLRAPTACVVNLYVARVSPYLGTGVKNGGYELPDWDPEGDALGDHKVSTDATDEAADGYNYLHAKLKAAGGVTITTVVDGGVRKEQISAASSIYDMPISIPGALTSAGKLWRFKCVRAIVLPEDAAGSYGNAGTAALAASTITLKKTTAAGVTTDIGTVTVAAGATAAVFTVAAAVSFAANDVFWGLNQTTADATLADLALTFKMEYA